MTTVPVRILIVEDDPDVRSYLTNLLHRHGYRVMAAGNVARALDLARHEAPTLMVLDALLPDDDVQRLYVALKPTPKTKGIPVIALSSLTRRVAWTSWLHVAGQGGRRLPEPDAFLSNPPEAEDFLEAISRLTGNPGPPQPQEAP